MTVKKIGMVGIAAALLLVILISPIAGAQSNEDDELDEMEEYLKDDKQTDLKITPTLEEGQTQFNKFSFSDESYDLLSLLNFLFYFLASGGTIWIGIIALIDILKGKSADAKSIYNDLKGRKSVQGIIIIVLSVKIVYILIDFLFNMEL